MCYDIQWFSHIVYNTTVHHDGTTVYDTTCTVYTITEYTTPSNIITSITTCTTTTILGNIIADKLGAIGSSTHTCNSVGTFPNLMHIINGQIAQGEGRIYSHKYGINSIILLIIDITPQMPPGLTV